MLHWTQLTKTKFLSLTIVLQWTYQAMIHELIGMRNNAVDLSGRPGTDNLVRKMFRNNVLHTNQEFNLSYFLLEDT